MARWVWLDFSNWAFGLYVSFPQQPEYSSQQEARACLRSRFQVDVALKLRALQEESDLPVLVFYDAPNHTLFHKTREWADARRAHIRAMSGLQIQLAEELTGLRLDPTDEDLAEYNAVADSVQAPITVLHVSMLQTIREGSSEQSVSQPSAGAQQIASQANRANREYKSSPGSHSRPAEFMSQLQALEVCRVVVENNEGGGALRPIVVQVSSVEADHLIAAACQVVHGYTSYLGPLTEDRASPFSALCSGGRQPAEDRSSPFRSTGGGGPSASAGRGSAGAASVVQVVIVSNDTDLLSVLPAEWTPAEAASVRYMPRTTPWEPGARVWSARISLRCLNGAWRSLREEKCVDGMAYLRKRALYSKPVNNITGVLQLPKAEHVVSVEFDGVRNTYKRLTLIDAIKRYTMWNDEPRLLGALYTAGLLYKYLGNVLVLSLIQDHDAGLGGMPPALAAEVLDTVTLAMESSLQAMTRLRQRTSTDGRQCLGNFVVKAAKPRSKGARGSRDGSAVSAASSRAPSPSSSFNSMGAALAMVERALHALDTGSYDIPNATQQAPGLPWYYHDTPPGPSTHSRGVSRTSSYASDHGDFPRHTAQLSSTPGSYGGRASTDGGMQRGMQSGGRRLSPGSASPYCSPGNRQAMASMGSGYATPVPACSPAGRSRVMPSAGSASSSAAKARQAGGAPPRPLTYTPSEQVHPEFPPLGWTPPPPEGSAQTFQSADRSRPASGRGQGNMKPRRLLLS